MNNKELAQSLIRIANILDDKNLHEEADILTKIASFDDDYSPLETDDMRRRKEYEEFHESEQSLLDDRPDIANLKEDGEWQCVNKHGFNEPVVKSYPATHEDPPWDEDVCPICGSDEIWEKENEDIELSEGDMFDAYSDGISDDNWATGTLDPNT